MTLLRRVHRIIVAGLLGAALVAALLLGSAARSSAASIPHAPVIAGVCGGTMAPC